MTTRRDFLIGMAGVAAAAAVPIEIIEQVTQKSYQCVIFNGANWINLGGMTVNGHEILRLSDSKPLYAGEIAVGESFRVAWNDDGLPYFSPEIG